MNCITGYLQQQPTLLAKQISIGWEHFIRGRITSSLDPVIDTYYRINVLGCRLKSFSWYRKIIQSLWKFHHTAWIEYCDTVHSSTKLNIPLSPTKNAFLTLVEKTKLKPIFSRSIRRFFIHETTLLKVEYQGSTALVKHRLQDTSAILNEFRTHLTYQNYLQLHYTIRLKQ